MATMAHGIAANYSSGCKYKPFERAMGFYGLAGIVRAAWVKPALWAHDRAESKLVNSDDAQKDCRSTTVYQVQQLGPNRGHD
jgi:hypothetical protein